MRGLKIAVVVMGVMLVFGVVVLIGTIATRVAHRTTPAAARLPFTADPIDLPAGARIEAMTAGADRLVIDLLLADGSRQILILDIATGRRIGVIPLRSAP